MRGTHVCLLYMPVAAEFQGQTDPAAADAGLLWSLRGQTRGDGGSFLGPVDVMSRIRSSNRRVVR